MIIAIQINLIIILINTIKLIFSRKFHRRHVIFENCDNENEFIIAFARCETVNVFRKHSNKQLSFPNRDLNKYNVINHNHHNQ